MPTTTATGSPTHLTSPLLSGMWSGVLTSTPGGAQTIGMPPSKLRSSAVKAPRTPGCAAASEVSIEVIAACASVERTIAAWTVPGMCRSSTKVAGAGDEAGVLAPLHRPPDEPVAAVGLRRGLHQALTSSPSRAALPPPREAAVLSHGRASQLWWAAAAACTALTMLW